MINNFSKKAILLEFARKQLNIIDFVELESSHSDLNFYVIKFLIAGTECFAKLSSISDEEPLSLKFERRYLDFFEAWEDSIDNADEEKKINFFKQQLIYKAQFESSCGAGHLNSFNSFLIVLAKKYYTIREFLSEINEINVSEYLVMKKW